MLWFKTAFNLVAKKRRRPTGQPVVDSKWEIESSSGLFKRTCWGLGLAFPMGIYMAIYYEIIIPIPKITSPDSGPVGVFIVPTRITKPQVETRRVIVKHEKPRGRIRGEGRPDVPNSVAVVKNLFSKKSRNQQLIDDILDKNSHDIEKVFDRLNKLERLGNSRIGDARKGKFIEDFNLGTGMGIKNGSELVLDNFNEAPQISTLPVKIKDPVIRTGSSREVDYSPGGSRRSSAEIMSTVRSHMPGIRHIYNSHLRQSPGFSGTIRVRFEISPSGKVVAVQKVSSNTKNLKFDSDILAKIIHWKFSSISGKGNDTVIIPLSFSE